VGDATIPSPFRLASSRRETEDTWTLELRPEGEAPLAFEPGQFTMLHCFGAGEVPISVSGDPSRPETLVHTVRAVGSATRAICEAGRGQVLGVRGPFGRGWPVESAQGGDLAIIAGGLGLAPLRPAVYAALAARERFDRVILLYGGRTPEELLFRSELGGWQRSEELEYAVTVDAAGRDWRGRVGVVTRLIAEAGIEPARTTAFACGPELMMRFAVEALLEAGVDPAATYVSMERNMRCAVGHCGHCQFGPTFVCRDGPVFPWTEVGPWLSIREL